MVSLKWTITYSANLKLNSTRSRAESKSCKPDLNVSEMRDNPLNSPTSVRQAYFLPTFFAWRSLRLCDPATHQNAHRMQNLEQKLEDLWRRESLLPTRLTLPHNEPFAFYRCLPTMYRTTHHIIGIAQPIGYRLITRHNIWVSAKTNESQKYRIP